MNNVPDDPLVIKEVKGGKPRKQIHKFLPKVPFYGCVYGKSACGKSVMIANMIKYYRKHKIFKQVLCFSATPNDTLREAGAKVCTNHIQVTDQGEINIIHELMELQKSLGGKAKDILVIFDDYITNSDLNRRRGTLVELFSMARHYQISVIITGQMVTLIPASLRRMAHNSFVFKISNTKERETMLKEIQRDLTEEQVYDVYHYCTNEKYSFLHVDHVADKYYLRLEKELDPTDP